MRLLLVVDAVCRIDNSTKIILIVPYLSYSRQDRINSTGEALGIKVLANCKVISLAEIVSNSPLAKKIIDENLVLVCPDSGAEKKILALAEILKINPPNILYVNKIRRLLTGDIIHSQVFGIAAQGKDYIVLGMIYAILAILLAAKILKTLEAGKIYLYATHAILSRGIDELAKHCYHILSNEDDINKGFLSCL
ncbi:MAG: ribose-phosphate pyrophosphokinase-like domain-containing protein [Candidatus Midichloria sp.]|nr:ribose-phosphate pyrophosphokinase-like domain-containing protein [Candidatus Midichloria sp.]